jgi:hypothetical protein
MEVLDYSKSRPDPKKVKALGYGAVARYLFASTKGITKAEAIAIRAAGLGLVVVYESYARRAIEGWAVGVADGKTALALARNIGFPENRPLYFAVDFAPTVVELVYIDAYLKGAASVIGLSRVGVYGSYAVVEHCHSVQSARWYWQTYAWSGGRVSVHTHFLQYKNGQVVAGALVDLNKSKQADFGAWMPVTTAPVPVKPVINPPKPPIKPVVKPIVAKPAVHLMTPAEMLAMVKNSLLKR